MGRFDNYFTRSSAMGSIIVLVCILSTSVSAMAVTVPGIRSTPSTPLPLTSDSAPDFRITATRPSSVPADGISLARAIIVVSPLDNFSGVVALSDSPLPHGLLCQAFSPPAVNVSGMSMLSCASTNPGSYMVTTTGTSELLVHNATTTFSFTATSSPYFTINAITPISFASGSFAISTVTVTSQHGFDSQVVLSSAVSPGTGLSVYLNPQHFLNGSGTSTATLSSSTVGSYIVTITATNGSSHRTATVQVTVTSPTPDITLSTSSSSLSFNSGSFGMAIITVESQNGFSGAISLAVTTPNGVSCDLSSSTVRSSGTSTLTCHGSTAGDYTVTITANGGASPHTTNVTVHVNAISPAAPATTTIFGLAPAIFYTTIGATVVAVIAGATLLLRKSKRFNR